jgi:glycine/D-amino acid oxidase-like deaminating enzyme
MSRGLAPVSGAERLRARRWDAVIVGSGVSGLVCAARLGAAGHRVLVVEEDAARGLAPALREPFFLAGARDSGALDGCVRTLNIPLIDQRRIAAERLAYQVVSPKFRHDVGGPSVTTAELASWGLADPDEAGHLIRGLVEATEAERKVMMASPLVRIGRRLSIARAGTPGSHVRGLPAEAATPGLELGAFLDAQAAALSNLATAEPTPESRTRLLGSSLAGGAGFGDSPPWLLGLLRRRVEAVYGEFRSVAGRLDLCSVDQQPGVAVEDTGELFVGRVLIVAAAPAALAANLRGEVPDFLDLERPTRRRIAVHLRADQDIVPRGMCPRLILMNDAGAAADPQRTISLTCFASPGGTSTVDLVARMRVEPDEDLETAEMEIEERVVALMPFSEGRVERRPQRRPLWDDDGFLEDPLPGTGWPAEVDLKVSSRPPVYRLDRAEVAGLGVEGDLLLGWRSGDAIAQELG